MILHKLLIHYARNREDREFFSLQARDAVSWLQRAGVGLNENTSVLDLGCGHGLFGLEIEKTGCRVTFADSDDNLAPEISKAKFVKFDIDKDDLEKLGTFDVVIFSNVFEHIHDRDEFLGQAGKLLKPGGFLYLSWTNWLSPWGGHGYPLLHYLGPKIGYGLYNKFNGEPLIYVPYKNLFPTYIGKTLKTIGKNKELNIIKVVPRYYPELAFIIRIPVVREFFTWNCVVLAQESSVKPV